METCAHLFIVTSARVEDTNTGQGGVLAGEIFCTECGETRKYQIDLLDLWNVSEPTGEVTALKLAMVDRLIDKVKSGELKPVVTMFKSPGERT